jgi:prepilin-type processing-associated H-X9-DG protein
MESVARDVPGKYNGLISLQDPSDPNLTVAIKPVRIQHVTDGLSHTAAIAERTIQFGQSPEDILNGPRSLQSFHLMGGPQSLEEMAELCDPQLAHADELISTYLGRAWISGWSATGGTYRHLKTPNTNHCHFAEDFISAEFAVTPTSNHVGGVNVVMADGHVEFFTDDVEHEIWWALGSRNGGESGGHDH